MEAEKVCPVCGNGFDKNTKYCSRTCYYKSPKSQETRNRMSKAGKGKKKSLHMREALSKATKGKPKPNHLGNKNPNYGGRYSSDPDVHIKFIEAVKQRGQPWGEEQKKAHSKKMLGDSNAMRGKNHTEECKQRLSGIIKKRYADGLVKVSLNKISKPEREIAAKLTELGIAFKPQFHISGVPYWYDFYFQEHNLIFEFHGDYWHANPKKYASGTSIRFFGEDKLVDDIWERDMLKREAAENEGYKFVSLWESDYKNNGIEILNEYFESQTTKGDIS